VGVLILIFGFDLNLSVLIWIFGFDLDLAFDL